MCQIKDLLDFPSPWCDDLCVCAALLRSYSNFFKSLPPSYNKNLRKRAKRFFRPYLQPVAVAMYHCLIVGLAYYHRSPSLFPLISRDIGRIQLKTLQSIAEVIQRLLLDQHRKTILSFRLKEVYTIATICKQGEYKNRQLRLVYIAGTSLSGEDWKWKINDYLV